jgi:hypothetical protein
MLLLVAKLFYFELCFEFFGALFGEAASMVDSWCCFLGFLVLFAAVVVQLMLP